MHDLMAINFICDAEVDFVRGMIPHHNGGIAMCNDLRVHQFELDWDLNHVCLHVETDQTREVFQMQLWLMRRSLDTGVTCGDGTMGCGDLSCQSSQDFVAANHEMHEGMAIHYNCDAQLDFALGMIPHHQGAIDMCGVLTKFYDTHTVNPDEFLVELCSNITSSQNSEIMEMQMWMNRVHPGFAPTPCDTHDMDMGNGGMNMETTMETTMDMSEDVASSTSIEIVASTESINEKEYFDNSLAFHLNIGIVHMATVFYWIGVF